MTSQLYLEVHHVEYKDEEFSKEEHSAYQYYKGR